MALQSLKELFYNMFLRNQWVWFHGLGGGVFALFLPIRVIFAIALIWEIIEAIYAKLFKGGVEKIYGSKKRFIQDSLGDIVFALMIALLVKLPIWFPGVFK